MALSDTQLLSALKEIARQGGPEHGKGEPRAATVAAMVAVLRRERPNLAPGFAKLYAGQVYDQENVVSATFAVFQDVTSGRATAQGVSDIVGGAFGGWTGLVTRIAVGAFAVVILAIGLVMLGKQQTLGGAVNTLKAVGS